jgi:molecular chaperone DnaK (HSP70)
MIESTAAAMSYGLLVAGDKNVLIFDMGGGSADVTVMNVNDGNSIYIYIYWIDINDLSFIIVYVLDY